MGKGSVWETRLGISGRFLRVLGWLVANTVQRPKLCGPKVRLDEPTIFAIRHVGLMDPLMLMAKYPGKVLHPLAAVDYFEKNAFTRWFYKSAQCIPIDRKNGSQEWLDLSMKALAKGESVIIAPEGRRNKSGKGVLPFRWGVSILAEKSGARVVPVWNELWKFPHRYRLAMGEPIYLGSMPEGCSRGDWLHVQTARIQDAVEALEKRAKA